MDLSTHIAVRHSLPTVRAINFAFRKSQAEHESPVSEPPEPSQGVPVYQALYPEPDRQLSQAAAHDLLRALNGGLVTVRAISVSEKRRLSDYGAIFAVTPI